MILDEYFNEDLSLSEIAENHNISKSAVYDTLKKSLEKLKEYETKLRCVYKEKKILQILSENNISKDIEEKIKEVLTDGIWITYRKNAEHF